MSSKKAFDIENVEISRPFEINFDKNKLLMRVLKSFFRLLLLIVNSSDQKN